MSVVPRVDLIRVLLKLRSRPNATYIATRLVISTLSVSTTTSGWFSFSLSATCTFHTASTTSPPNSRNCSYRGRSNRYSVREMYAIERLTSICALSRRT